MLALLEEKLKKEREYRELSLLEKPFLFALQEQYNALKVLDDPISRKKLQLLEEGIEELVELRAEKILRGESTHLLPAERPLAEFRITFKKFKKDVLKSLLQKETSTCRVMVLEDLPQFYGPEMNVLGPFKKGEVILLDNTIATLLKEKGLVEER
ncbi:MAG: hypothetical protein HXS47_04425 [Theionarchaea archaeon]|nr:hypothetical protein [Theionarchaea archaeon]